MQHDAEYDITKAFKRIEDELIASMMRNMDRHRAEEDEEGILWTQWQTEQLKALEKYKKQNQKKYNKQFQDLNKRMEELIRAARDTGNMDQEIEILEAIKNGFTGYDKSPGSMQAQFFKMNERKLEALISATTYDMQKAETAVLRMANDKYRKVIFDAQVYANTGAGTYEKAVDMATKDMLAAGLNCVEYANGARHTLADYADMAIRTASKRAYLQGEGQKRQEWGVATVIVNKRGNPCPKCLPFCGKVLIDDVWSGGSQKDGNYPLMSYAISKGLYHPRCKDAHTTYFPGISTADDTWTAKELEAIGQNTKVEAKQQYAERQAERYGRLAKYSLDEENRQKYKKRADVWRNARFKTGDMDLKDYVEEQRLKDYYSKPLDITNKWEKIEGLVENEPIDLLEYTVNGTKYDVDGRHVVLDYTEHEKGIAEAIAKSYGRKVEMVPRVLYPQKIQTPDYLIDGIGYDLKTPIGNGKNTMYGTVKSKKRQANNFIICIDKTELSLAEIEEQIQGIYTSNHTRFVDTILIMQNKSIIRAFKRRK